MSFEKSSDDMKKSMRVFVGAKLSGGGPVTGRTIVGRIQSLKGIDEDEIMILEPIVAEKLFVMSPQGQPGITMQLMNDPYFPVKRDFTVTVNVSHWDAWYILDPSDEKDLAEITKYDRTLSEAFAAAAGIQSISSARRP